MAQKTVVVDDLTGTIVEDAQAHTEVTLAFEGTEVVLDLSDENYVTLSQAVKPFLDAGESKPRQSNRRSDDSEVSVPRQGGPGGQAAQVGDLGAVREWAKKNGFKISARGRVPYSVMDAYTKAHLSRR